MTVKAKDIEGFLVEKKVHQEGLNDYEKCDAFNLAITQQGERSITLNRERLAEIIYKTMAPITALWQEWKHEKSRSQFYEIADAIIKDLQNLVEVVK